MARTTFPKADPQFTAEVYHLGRAAVSRIAGLTREEVYQSVRAAAEAHETGISFRVILDRHTHLCGPKKRRRT